jgi:ABC-type spermidine/putrescine transport system permease subunit II
VLSFNDSEITGFPFTGFSLRWYRSVLGNPVLLEAFGHSVAVGAVAAIVSTALALGLALAFRHDFRGKGMLLNLVLVPIVVPGIIGGIVLLIFFGYAQIRPSLMTTVLVAHVNWVLPFAFLTLYPRVHRFDQTLEEAAMDLGAHPRQIFLRIVLPIIRPGIIATALFSFSLSFDEFIRTVFVVGEERTVPIQFWTMIVDRLAPELPAMAVLIVLVSIAAALLGFTYAKRADAGAARTAR